MPTSPSPKRQRPTRKKQNNMSPEGRQRLSELAKQRHAEGKMGGSEFGKLGGRGNTRAKREAQQAVASSAAEHKEEIISVFKDAIDPDRPMGQRLKGAELWLAVERENAKLQMAEQAQDAQELDRATLIHLLAEKLSTGPAAALVKAQLEDGSIVDAEVVEIDDDNQAAA